MLDYIDAPIPFVIGIPNHLWEKTKKEKEKALNSDIVTFDVDKNKLTCKNDFPRLPSNILEVVISNLFLVLEEYQKISFLYKNPIEKEHKVFNK